MTAPRDMDYWVDLINQSLDDYLYPPQIQDDEVPQPPAKQPENIIKLPEPKVVKPSTEVKAPPIRQVTSEPKIRKESALNDAPGIPAEQQISYCGACESNFTGFEMRCLPINRHLPIPPDSKLIAESICNNCASRRIGRFTPLASALRFVAKLREEKYLKAKQSIFKLLEDPDQENTPNKALRIYEATFEGCSSEQLAKADAHLVKIMQAVRKDLGTGYFRRVSNDQVGAKLNENAKAKAQWIRASIENGQATFARLTLKGAREEFPQKDFRDLWDNLEELLNSTDSAKKNSSADRAS